MKKLFLISLLFFAMMNVVAACSNSNNSPEDEPIVTGDGKMLIVYFSYPEPDGVDASSGASRLVINNAVVGSTEFLANVIEEATGADVFRIETARQYPASHEPLVAQARQELDNGVRPALATRIENLEQYDIIFIGYPNWWGDMPMPLYTFLESYDFKGKTLVPFNSHGGSGLSETIDSIRNLQPEATVTNGFSVSRNTVGSATDDVLAWLERLGITK